MKSHDTTSPEHPRLPLPTPVQQRWQDYEVGVVYHFDIPVYRPEGWAWEPAYREVLDPELYNPARLDTDQWLEAARAAGAGYAILTATHMGGFRQWQSEAYPYGCRQTRWRHGRGDLVADFVDSCRRYGIAPGLYVSVRFNAFCGAANTLLNGRHIPGRESAGVRGERTDLRRPVAGSGIRHLHWPQAYPRGGGPEVAAIRLTVTDSVGEPHIRRLAAFDAR